MTTEIAPFTYLDSQVRVVTDPDGVLWFVAKDVCDILGTATRDLRKVLDEDELSNTDTIHIGEIATENGGRAPLLVSESGLYSLVLRSDKPEALAFQAWITDEVLPSIRRHGGSEVLPGAGKNQQAADDGVVPFRSAEFGQVRTIEQDGRVLFCGRDVATALGYTNPGKAVRDHCKGGPFQTPLPTDGGTQLVRFITEGDLYRLVASSKLPAAERFEAWVFDEVLPSIRRRGGYLTPEATEAALTDPDFIIRLATSLKEERAKSAALEAQVEADAPHTTLGRAVATADGDCLVKAVADVLTQNGLPTTQNQLFGWMRTHGWLCRTPGDMWNRPTKHALDHGWLRTTERTITTPAGQTRQVWTTRVTGTGQAHLIDSFLSGRYTLKETRA